MNTQILFPPAACHRSASEAPADFRKVFKTLVDRRVVLQLSKNYLQVIQQLCESASPIPLFPLFPLFPFISLIVNQMWSNFHTHSHYCDGKGTIADYLNAASNAGIQWIGFSSHAPLPFSCKWCMKIDDLPGYLAEIDEAKQSFPGIEIYRGLEVDYIPEVVSPMTFADRLDYTIGSIHFVESFLGKGWEIDNTLEIFKDGLHKIFDNNIRAAVTRYLELTRAMLSLTPPDILGHMDKIKVNAADLFFDESESWYRKEIEKTIDTIENTNTIVEVNTRGMYKKKLSTPYPSPWILEQLYHRNIRITISSDAHHPEDLTREFEPTRRLLADVGFKNVTVLKENDWKQIPLDAYGITR